MLRIDCLQLQRIENGRRLGNAGQVKFSDQLRQGIDLVFPLGRPAQQGDVIDHRLRQEALGDQILEGSVPVPLGQLVVGVLHHRGAVDVMGHLPAERLVQQIVLGGAGQILVAPYHMGDAHGMIVHHVGKIVGGHAVGLDEDLVVQGGVLHGNIPVDLIVEGGGALLGHLLPDHIGHARIQLLLHLLRGQVPAVAVIHGTHAIRLMQACKPFLVAEAVVGVPLLHQLQRIVLEHAHPLRLHIGPHRAADVRALVPGDTRHPQGPVDHVYSTLHIALLVCILNAENEISAVLSCDKVSV